MTATLAAPTAVSRTAAHRTPRPPGRLARRHMLSTPSALRGLLAALVLLSLAWGAFGGWVATLHSSAADSLVSTDERLSLGARDLYQSLADADATMTAAFLSSAQPMRAPLARYDSDLATASADLSLLQASGGSQTAQAALAKLSGGLYAYNGYVAEAKSEYAMGYPLTGGSFLQVASEEAHLVLLPAASTVFTQENDALGAASGAATELPTVIAIAVLALITAFAFYRAQRWLSRRTHRVFSPGLVLASLLLAISVIWLAAAFVSARSDLDRGIGHGSGPAQNLALASIGVQQIRGDSVLNVISRSQNASFQDDFIANSKKVGPGPGTWLGESAAAQQPGGQGAALVADAERDAAGWYPANDQVYRLGRAANYAGERALVVGSTTGNTLTAYDALEVDLSHAIAADTGVFQSAATSGANTLDPLLGVMIASSVGMALGCGWAVTRRLAEYH